MKHLSHSLIETYQRCEKKWEYRYIRGYRPRIMGAKVELGSWVHSLLEAYYRAMQAGNKGPEPEGAVELEHQRLLREKWNVLLDEEQELLGADLPETARQIVHRYIQRYRAEDQAQWRKILLVEAEIKVRLPGMKLPFVFVCDLVTQDRQGWVRIYDHKVVGTIPDEDSRLIDPQGARYVLAMQEFFRRKGIKVPGVVMVYDYVRDKLPSEPKPLQKGGLSKAWIDTEPDTYLAAVEKAGLNTKDYEDILDRIRREGKPFFDRWATPKSEARLSREFILLRELDTRLTAPDRSYIRTLDRHRCSWDCEFRDLCLLELEGGSIKSLLAEKFEVVGGSAKEAI